jgi:hypothetical protein
MVQDSDDRHRRSGPVLVGAEPDEVEAAWLFARIANPAVRIAMLDLLRTLAGEPGRAKAARALLSIVDRFPRDGD